MNLPTNQDNVFREPGGEHVKHLVVKNVVMKTQKIKYKLPQTRYFSMEFPETQTLSAGMSWTVPITFRPVAKECYNDVIEFTTSFGKFYLPIKATLPEHVLEFPESIDFGLCPVRETAKKTFTLKNVGELSSAYEWEISKPFSITPRVGTLPPGQSVAVTIEFRPEDASVFTATAICNFGDKANWSKTKVSQPITVYGIGKYSHLTIENKVQTFNFGEVFVGKSMEKKFVLVNHSAVVSNFRIEQAERDTDPYFVFSTMSGSIGSKKKMEISITYTPVAAGMVSTEYYDITAISGNKIRIICTGSGVGPKVTFNTQIVNFNDVPAGTTVTRPLYIQNSCTTPAFYQFLAEPNSIFRIDRPWGVINPHSSVALTIKFSPTEPINYYRRLYCLVEHQDGLYVDILGTCYNDKRRPATFNPKMIENYKMRVKNGLWSQGPEHLEEMLKNGTIKCDNGVLSYVDLTKQPANPPPLDAPYGDGIIASQYFYENTGTNQSVTLMDTYVDFGSCSRNTFPPGEDTFIPKIDFGATRLDFPSCHVDKSVYRTVRISNTGDTPVKFSFVDLTPSQSYTSSSTTGSGYTSMSHGIGGGTPLASEGGAPFSVKPRTGILHKNESKLIVFRFSPTMYDLHVRGVGYIPQISFDNQNTLCFKPTCVGSLAKRVFQIRNTSRILVNFEWKIPEQYAPYVSITPTSGTLLPNSSQSLECAFLPNAARNWLLRLPCYYFHEIEGESQQQVDAGFADLYNRRRTTLTVIGKGITADIVAEPKVVDFGAVLVNTIVEKEIVLFNPSECDLFYDLEICAVKEIEVGEPVDGELDASAQVSQPAPALTSSLSDNVGAAEPVEEPKPSLWKKFEQVPIVNSVRESEVDVVQVTDILPARSNHALKVRICVRSQTERTFKLYYRLKASSDEKYSRIDEAGSVSAVVQQKQDNPSFPLVLSSKKTGHEESVYLCDIKAIGVHPVVQVTDLRSDGLGKSLLWQLFSLNQFNSSLEAVEAPLLHGSEVATGGSVGKLEDDLDFPTHTPTSMLSDGAENNSLDFNFGAAPIGSRTTVVHLSLMNPGVVPVEWVYYFPNDLEVEIENWADPGDYTEEQLHTNLILDNALFTVTPKSGVLNPGESVHIVMSYSHEFAGIHKLPVVFKLKNGSTRAGKEIVINFVGYTVPAQQKYVHFHSTKHVFDTVSIGASEPPTQTYLLTNRGSVTVDYTIDTSPLKTLKANEHDFDIITCRKDKGSIAPGATEQIEWVFRPLEAKEYEVDIPFIIDGGQTQIITFSGKGMNPPVPYNSTELLSAKNLVDSIPAVQKLNMPRQIAELSVERLNFGHVPIGVLLRQVLVVKNISTNFDLSFRWIIPANSWSLRITPAVGRLKPGESKLCKMTLKPCEEVQIINTDIVCEITNESQRELYDARMEEIQIARREGRLVSPDPSGSAGKTRNHRAGKPQSASSSAVAPLKQLPKGSARSESNLRAAKYQPLPEINNRKSPIPQTTKTASSTGPKSSSMSADFKKSSANVNSAAVEVDQRSNSPPSTAELLHIPQKPEPFNLFLAILGHTYPVNEFTSQFKDFGAFYHPRRTIHAGSADTTLITDPVQQDIILNVMFKILDEIIQDLDDPSFQDNLRKTREVSYFAQITTKRQNGVYLVEGSPEDKNADVGSGKPSGNGEDDRGQILFDEAVLRSTEFQNSIEAILEGTLYNLIQEAELQEFDLTKDPLLIWPDK
ncbi:hypothetical protein HDV05_007637 [Chytridiales sp. JEL 0842]|nr:hypothetical protein HDV05_007637 [Chytridiales sp. JEL 0842]